jgi:hypothetical protein
MSGNHMNDVIVIDLWPHFAECWACGAFTPCRWGLPVGDCGKLVSNDYTGEWGGVPACQQCYQAHAEGLLTERTLVWWRRRMELKRRALEHLIVRE